MQKLDRVPLLEQTASSETSIQVAKYSSFKSLMRSIYLNNSKGHAFDLAARAAQNNQILSINYVERVKHTHTKAALYQTVMYREIEIYSIRRHYNKIQHRSYYYLYAYSYFSPIGIRSYRIDRIQSAILLKRKYAPRWIVELNQKFFDDLRKSIGMQITTPNITPTPSQQTNTTPQQPNTKQPLKPIDQPKVPSPDVVTPTMSSKTTI